MRLPLAAIQQLLGTLADRAGGSAESLKQGFRVLVADGTGFSMPDTPELREHFGVPPRQKPGVGYPVCKLMGILDLASGMLIHTLAMPLFTHDMKGIAQLQPKLRSGDVLVGDRAFCSVTHLMMLGLRKVHSVFRLHQRRPIQRRGGIIRWQRPEKCPVWLDCRMFKTLPPHIELRLIRHVIVRKGYRTRVLWLVSTLPMTWSDQEVIDLYRRRWEIETCFGCLKTGMKMNVLKCRSVDGVMKELAVYLLVYNLVRLIMLAWAQQMQVDVRRISLSTPVEC